MAFGRQSPHHVEHGVAVAQVERRRRRGDDLPVGARRPVDEVLAQEPAGTGDEQDPGPARSPVRSERHVGDATAVPSSDAHRRRCDIRTCRNRPQPDGSASTSTATRCGAATARRRPTRSSARSSRAGIDVLCITDHNAIAGAVELAGAPAVPGRRRRGDAHSAGEMIGLFLTERVPIGTPPAETRAGDPGSGWRRVRAAPVRPDAPQPRRAGARSDSPTTGSSTPSRCSTPRRRSTASTVVPPSSPTSTACCRRRERCARARRDRRGVRRDARLRRSGRVPREPQPRPGRRSPLGRGPAVVAADHPARPVRPASPTDASPDDADPPRHRARPRPGTVGVPADLVERAPAARPVAVRVGRLRLGRGREGVRRRPAPRHARRRRSATSARTSSVYVRDGLRLVVHRERPATPEGRLAWLLVLSTLPAARSARCSRSWIDEKLGTPVIIGISLIVFGLLLAWADRSTGQRKVEEYGVRDSVDRRRRAGAGAEPGHVAVGDHDHGRPTTRASTATPPPGSAS